MNFAALAGAGAAGLALGLFYFGGLWWTVRRAASFRQPALGFALSYLMRNAVVFAGFYVAMDGRGERLVACLVGFLVARTVLIGRWGQVSHNLDQAAGTLGRGGAGKGLRGAE